VVLLFVRYGLIIKTKATDIDVLKAK